MSTESWSHGQGCLCERCIKRREYFKKYYKAHKEKILKKNRLWMRQHRKYPRSSLEAVRSNIAATKRSKYGRNYFKLIGSRGGARVVQLYGISYLVSNLRKHWVDQSVWRIAIDKESNIRQASVLDRINNLMDNKYIGK